MKPIAVLYATREGHTRHIASEVAKVLGTHSLEARVFDLGHAPAPVDLRTFSAVVLASPVHMGTFASEMVAFVRKHRAEIDGMTNAFISVTLSEAGVERDDTTPEQHAKFVAEVNSVNEKFFEQADWHPTRLKNVAGALAYSHYNFLVRIMMKRIAKASGGSTDTSHDHDYTNWEALDRFVASFAKDVIAGARQPDHLPS